MNSGALVEENLAQAEHWLQAAAEQGASLALLPENFALMTADEPAKLALAEPLGNGPIQRQLREWARRFDLWIVAGSLPIQPAAALNEPRRVHTSSCVFDDRGELVSSYNKIHLFDVLVNSNAGQAESAEAASEDYQESATYLAGTELAQPVSTPLGKLGLSICYDIRFPELYRQLRIDEAQLVSVPAAFTVATGEAHWETLLRARAIENQCFVLAANQCGIKDNGRGNWGHSMIVDPWGRLLAEQTQDCPGVIVAELDVAAQQRLRTEMPVVRHATLLAAKPC